MRYNLLKIKGWHIHCRLSHLVATGNEKRFRVFGQGYEMFLPEKGHILKSQNRDTK